MYLCKHTKTKFLLICFAAHIDFKSSVIVCKTILLVTLCGTSSLNIYRWSPEPCSHLRPVSSWKGTLEKIPYVFPLSDNWFFLWCRHHFCHVLRYVLASSDES